jgi:hypothetical membrane protein
VASVVPIWLLAVVAAVLVGIFAAPADVTRWLPVSLAAIAIVAFAVQLGIQRKEGFVLRVMASITGAVIVLAVATLVLPLVA